MNDGFFSSIVGIVFIIVFGFLYCQIGKKSEYRYRLKLFRIVSFIYILSAYIASFSFDGNRFILTTDAKMYIEKTSLITNYSWSDAKYDLENCYLSISDNNGLFNVIREFIGFIFNEYFDGVSSFSLCLLLVFFGILSAITLYRIMTSFFLPNESLKYVLAFSLLSIFHLYSILILRDIVIAFVYLLCIEIIIRRFSLINLFVLFIYMIIAWGLRLYSGLFIVSFILFYIFKAIRNSRAKNFLMIVFCSLCILLIMSSYFLIQQTSEEIEVYVEYTKDGAAESGGLINNLLSLPPVVKEIALVLFSQMSPFPPYTVFYKVNFVTDIYISALVVISEIWWFLVVYSFLYVLILKKKILSISFDSILLLLIVLVYILANTSHPDVRRMMPIYPIIYIMYLLIKNKYTGIINFSKIRTKLISIYCLLLVVYVIIK